MHPIEDNIWKEQFILTNLPLWLELNSLVDRSSEVEQTHVQTER